MRRHANKNASKNTLQKNNGGKAKSALSATTVLSLILAFLFIAAAASINLYQADVMRNISLESVSRQPYDSHPSHRNKSSVQSDTIQHSATLETLTIDKSTNHTEEKDAKVPVKPPCDLLNLALAKQSYFTKKQAEDNRHYSELQILEARRWLGRLMQPGWYSSKLSRENQKHQSILGGLYTEFAQAATNLNCPTANP